MTHNKSLLIITWRLKSQHMSKKNKRTRIINIYLLQQKSWNKIGYNQFICLMFWSRDP
ncbi:unnamed protein product [Paramecium sonneborni]|uniref:Uncharacterized protein n=1 Tax=Paramecium sonneborni TaxID=65129 RepID=A0A8S1NBV2_9CILI|nr:unnamed protein product [Paramecium sonneborni]